MSAERLSEVTGIHQATMLRWCRERRKETGVFAELAVVSQSRVPSKARDSAEVEIHTTRGHHVRLSLSALSELFRAEVL
jgi:hypothetical protein